jgi:hypothetical protein
VCGTLFGGIKLFELYSPKPSSNIQKYDGLENIEKPTSLALEITLGSSTDPNLGHNQSKTLKNVCGKVWYF